MAGNIIGNLKGKVGFGKPKYEAGSMIAAMNKSKGKKEVKTKPQGKGIVKTLGQKGTTGNFKKIEKAKGKGAAIASLQNKLAKRRGNKIPYGNKK